MWKDTDKLVDLFMAVSSGHTQALEEAIADGFDPQQDYLHGYSIVYYAMCHGRETLSRVRELVHTVDMHNDIGHTPLMDAIGDSNHEQVSMLLQLGASTEATCNTEQNALHLAALNPNNTTIADLVASQATLHSLMAQDMSLDTPITLAAACKSFEIAEVYCTRFVTLQGPLDMKTGVHDAPLCYYLHKSGAHQALETMVQAGASRDYLSGVD